MNNTQKFADIAQELCQLYEKKNQAYGKASARRTRNWVSSVLLLASAINITACVISPQMKI